VTAFSSDVFLKREAHFGEERERQRGKGMLKGRETERERVKWAGFGPTPVGWVWGCK